MPPVTRYSSPVDKEYFQSTYDRVYKICNRYKKCQKTLDKLSAKSFSKPIYDVLHILNVVTGK